jgi:hypothetical protein
MKPHIMLKYNVIPRKLNKFIKIDWDVCVIRSHACSYMHAMLQLIVILQAQQHVMT